MKKECKINTSSILKQIINERDSPLSIFREAISNSFDANASVLDIDVEKSEDGEINISFEDNGEGMGKEELEQFFNAGYTSKDESKIGEKGLGTKLFFNSKKIEVITNKNGIAYKGRLNKPLEKLRKDEVPEYQFEKEENSNFHEGTKIKIQDLKTNNSRDIFWGNNLKNYLRWKTAAGSIRHFFNEGKNIQVHVNISFNSKNKSFEVKGHPLPESNKVEEPDKFAYQFDPFKFKIEDSSEPIQVEIVGSIVGSEAHIVKDKRMKKKYKGFFLCKDYFPIRSVNEEVFGNSGEWQSMHVLVNCQNLKLTMGREDFLNKEEEKSTFKKIIDILKTFKNSILNGEPFHWNGKLIENTENYAGKGYEKLQTLKKKSESKKLDFKRVTTLLQKKKKVKRFDDENFPFTFEPNDKLSTFSIFLILLGKDSFSNKYKVFDTSMEGERISVLMNKNNGSKMEKPTYYAVEKCLNDKKLTQIKDKYDGVICWESNIQNEEEIGFKEIIYLTDHI